jgi:hypothetical protein
MAMNCRRIALTLRGVRETIEEGCETKIGQVVLPASDVLEDVCRAFALSDEETAGVLGEVEQGPPTLRQAQDAATLAIPVLGRITGGPEDAAVWERVNALFDGRS